MIVNCPKKNQQTDLLICLYRCPLRTKAMCLEYLKNYETILAMEIEEKYLEKYGVPVIVVPNSLRKRRKRVAPPEGMKPKRRRKVGKDGEK